MKIVFVLPEMLGGGSERVVAALSGEFVKRGYEVGILLFAGKQVVYELDSRVEVCSVGEESKGNPLTRIKRIINMRKYYKKNKGCYIFSFSVMGTVFSVLAAAGIPHRLLVSERNDPSKIPLKHKIVRNWSYRYAEKLVFQTDDMVEYFPKDIQKKSVVIPNPVSSDIPKPYVGKRDNRIVNVARLQPQKNHKLLIDAFSIFNKIHSEYELHIYGQGELEDELRKQTKQLGIVDKAIFHGFSNNVKEEIKNAAMFVLSSDYEGISNSMIEALAMGIPTISTDCPVGGSRMYIENEVSGLLTPVGDADKLSKAMIKMVEDSNLAARCSENSIKITDLYSLEKIASRFLKAANINERD